MPTLPCREGSQTLPCREGVDQKAHAAADELTRTWIRSLVSVVAVTALLWVACDSRFVFTCWLVAVGAVSVFRIGLRWLQRRVVVAGPILLTQIAFDITMFSAPLVVWAGLGDGTVIVSTVLLVLLNTAGRCGAENPAGQCTDENTPGKSYSEFLSDLAVDDPDHFRELTQMNVEDWQRKAQALDEASQHVAGKFHLE